MTNDEPYFGTLSPNGTDFAAGVLAQQKPTNGSGEAIDSFEDAYDAFRNAQLAVGPHDSDCALHNEPAMRARPCDCSRLAAGAVADLLIALGVDEGDHTTDTPARVARAWRDMLRGYNEDPSAHLLKTFSAPDNPGLVIVEGVTVNSTCAHHMLPFTGYATVAYRPSPGQQIVGLSKLARVVHGYAARLQVQERIGAQVVDAIIDRLNPSGAMVLITATHDCMRLRGVSEPSAATTTEARHGLLLEHEVALIQARHHAQRPAR